MNIGSALPSWIDWTSPNLTITCEGTQTVDITITGTDSHSLETTHTINIESVENDAPVVVGTVPSYTVEDNVTFTYSLDISTYFTDTDVGDVLTYSTTNVPIFVTSSTTGGILTVSGTVSDTNVGSQNITLNAYDG